MNKQNIYMLEQTIETCDEWTRNIRRRTDKQILDERAETNTGDSGTQIPDLR